MGSLKYMVLSLIACPSARKCGNCSHLFADFVGLTNCMLWHVMDLFLDKIHSTPQSWNVGGPRTIYAGFPSS